MDEKYNKIPRTLRHPLERFEERERDRGSRRCGAGRRSPWRKLPAQMASTGATDGPFKTQARSRRTCHSLKADGREDEPTQPSERPLPGHGNAARSPGPRRSGGHGPAKAGDAEREASPREALRRCASLESPSCGEPSPSATRSESLRRGACPFVDLVTGEERLFRPVCPCHT